jgi:hypothetical protein
MDRYSITASAVACSEGRSLGGPEIDRKVGPGRLLDRNIRRLRSTQNLVDVLGGATDQIRKITSE